MYACNVEKAKKYWREDTCFIIKCLCGYSYIWNSNHCGYAAVCNNFCIPCDWKAGGNASQNTILVQTLHVANSSHVPVEQSSTGTRPLILQSRSDIHAVFLFSVIKVYYQCHWHSSPDVQEWDFALALWMSCTIA